LFLPLALLSGYALPAGPSCGVFLNCCGRIFYPPRSGATTSALLDRPAKKFRLRDAFAGCTFGEHGSRVAVNPQNGWINLSLHGDCSFASAKESVKRKLKVSMPKPRFDTERISGEEKLH
jgi:hypothetical protein